MRIETSKFKLAAYEQGSRDAQRVGLVLPGFLDTKDHPHIRSHVEMLGSLGFHALAFDPPGTWDSSGGIASYTMTNWLAAIEEVIANLGSRPTFVMGHSRGGMMAMLSSVRIDNVFAFASVMSKASYAPDVQTIHPVEQWEREGYKLFHVTKPNHPGQKQLFKVPFSVVADTRNYNAQPDLAKLAKPKLFIQGLRDTAITPELVEAAYHASAEPKRLASVDSDHLYRRDPATIEAVNRLVASFLESDCRELP